MPDLGKDIFAAGCILSLLLCGNHIPGLEYEDQLDNAKCQKLQDANWLTKVAGIEAFDLVARMICDQEDIAKCITHPVFWEPSKKFLFVSEIVRKKKVLPTGESLRLGEDCREKLPSSGLLSAPVNDGTSHYGRSPSDFLQMLRTFYQHPPDKAEFEACFRTALEELRRFPSLFLHLYSIFGSFEEVVVE